MERKSTSSDVITRAYLDSLLVEVRHLDAVMPSTEMTVYGKTFQTPVATAALSHMHRQRENGMAEMAKGAHEAGALVFSGMGPQEELEGMIATGASVIKIIKTYADRQSIYDKIRHAEAHGALAVGLDIDHAFSRSGYDVVEGLPMLPLTSKELADMVKFTKLPFVIKGVLSVHDALLCRDIGAKGIVVSHHGGRFKAAVPPLFVLPEIAKALDKSMPIFVDCGVASGLDAFKALALGATAVSVGGHLIPAARESGEKVAARILEMTNELRGAMAFTGTKTLKDFDASMVHRFDGGIL